MVVAASWCDDGLHVSLSHPSRPTRRLDGLPHALGCRPVSLSGTAVTHTVIAAERMPVRPTGVADGAGDRDRHQGDAPPVPWSYAHLEYFPEAGTARSSHDGYFGERSSL
jgi:hypothetical protein